MNFLFEFSNFRPKITDDSKLNDMMYDLDHILREISDNQSFPFVNPFKVSMRGKNTIFAEIGPVPAAHGSSYYKPFIVNEQIIETLERCVDYVDSQSKYEISIYFSSYGKLSNKDISRNLEKYLGEESKFIDIKVYKMEEKLV